ncbi:type VI secretion system baseplate subunit TssE [Halomonas campisalis]|uniref:Type VI secretion system baseplate subunit TssE n=1 Tax=Billgrantia campisalis TaxID=74661 RepID=A0ABS9P7B4_9GAMM|nr:type VI secretion system baseplate subunit TssE [Halomonas campisalis]MCG6657491.1 type VI secretion system baseplate subunit TssE [Halomonas campisalis]MDR5863162.1 type VI secretion system baseplate subunit TssE [Halomonas campisalis]
MPELLNREALQPSLLDRLTDRARFLERLGLAYRDEALDQAGLSRETLRDMLGTLGMVRVVEQDQEGIECWENHPEVRPFRQVLALRPRPEAPPLSALLEVRQRRLVANRDESRDDRVISSRRLRQLVLRDLGWLLNTGCLSDLVPLEGYPQVERSVLNYGVPETAGLNLSGTDAPRLAERLRSAIERFEPRIRHVLVTPLEQGDDDRLNTLVFLIEGELWGHPLPEQLYLHTELDLHDASIRVRDVAER